MPTTIGLPFEAVPVKRCRHAMLTLFGGCRIQCAFHGGIDRDIGIVGNASQSGSGGMVGMLAARPSNVRGYFARFLIEAHDVDLSKAAALVGIGIELIIRRHERAVAHGGRAVALASGAHDVPSKR